MGLDESIETLKFDKRMEDWNLRHGVISKDDLEKKNANLEDSTPNAEYLNVHETSLQKAEFDNSGDPADFAGYSDGDSGFGQSH